MPGSATVISASVDRPITAEDELIAYRVPSISTTGRQSVRSTWTFGSVISAGGCTAGELTSRSGEYEIGWPGFTSSAVSTLEVISISPRSIASSETKVTRTGPDSERSDERRVGERGRSGA